MGGGGVEGGVVISSIFGSFFGGEDGGGFTDEEEEDGTDGLNFLRYAVNGLADGLLVTPLTGLYDKSSPFVFDEEGFREGDEMGIVGHEFVPFSTMPFPFFTSAPNECAEELEDEEPVPGDFSSREEEDEDDEVDPLDDGREEAVFADEVPTLTTLGMLHTLQTKKGKEKIIDVLLYNTIH